MTEQQTTSLPPGFEMLEEFVPRWSLETFAERMDARHGGDLTEMRDFYDAIVPHVTAIYAALRPYPLNGLPVGHRHLYAMLMSLAHVAHAVERHNGAMPRGTHYPYAVTVIAGPTPA